VRRGNKAFALCPSLDRGHFFCPKIQYLKKKAYIYTENLFTREEYNLFLFIKILAGFIIVLIIVGVTLAAKMLEEDHKKKTRNYRLCEEERKRRTAHYIDDKDSFQSYRDKDPAYQDALRAVQGFRDKGSNDDRDKGGCPF
jgi:hypothetical protein